MKRSLNGGQTRPLTAHARAELAQLARAPVPRCSINPGVVDRLTREGLAELRDLPSPFAAHRGGTCQHLVITEAGKRVIKWRTPE